MMIRNEVLPNRRTQNQHTGEVRSGQVRRGQVKFPLLLEILILLKPTH